MYYVLSINYTMYYTMLSSSSQANQTAVTIAPTPLYDSAFLGTSEGNWFTISLGFDDTLEAFTAGEDDVDMDTAAVLSDVSTFQSGIYLSIYLSTLYYTIPL